MRSLILVVLCAMGLQAWSQGLSEEEARIRGLTFDAGKIFTVKYVPGERKVIVGVVGKPALEAGPDKVTLTGRELHPGGKKRDLTIKSTGPGFEIENEVDPKSTLEFDVEDRRTHQRETLRPRRQSKP